MRTLCYTLICCMVALFALAACQQKPYPIFFLKEEDSSDGMSAKFIIRYRNHTYTKLPILNHEHLASYHSFMDMQTGSYGAVFTLKKEWATRLRIATTNARGKLILPVVAGYAFQPVRIDAPIVDGKLVIWSGLTGYDLKQIARDIKPEDPELEKKRFKDKDSRPRPTLDTKNKPQKKDYTGRTIGELYSSADS